MRLFFLVIKGFFSTMSSVGFIGAGNIATAIIGGAIQSGYITPKNIYIYDVDIEKCKKLSIYGVNVSDCVQNLLDSCSYVFLTVKPQIYEQVLQEIKPYAKQDTVFVSVGAGITVSYVKNQLSYDAKVIRVMPNTPLLYGNGATALAHIAPVTKAEFDFICSVFSSGGTTCIVDESLMNAVTGVTGSSPAFIFRFAKVLIDSGIQAGMAEQDARAMVIKTLLGSAVMLQQSGMTADELIQMVASPNGTTVAGLQALDDARFDKAVYSAVSAAIQRAEELQK